MTGPGYARPTTKSPPVFAIDIGVSNGPVINWRPVGAYEEAAFGWSFDLPVPGTAAFTLHPDHRLNSVLAACERTVFHVRIGYGEDGQYGYNGEPWEGRVMKQSWAGPPGREKWLYTCLDNKRVYQSLNIWVNNLFPPEVQIGLTGKQNVKWGQPDPVAKLYLAEAATRLNKPWYGAFPIHRPGAFDYTNLSDVDTLDELIQLATETAENTLVKSARFTMFDELLKDDFARLQIGGSMRLWDGRGTPPKVFNTSSLGALQSIIDYTSDDFLNPSLLSNVGSLWRDTADRACLVFDTVDVRDNRKCQFRTDSGQILHVEGDRQHAEVTRAIVGGKSPAILNDAIEIGANLGIQILLNAIAPGLGLGFVVGDLFDDIFFAYQVFWDQELIDDLGNDFALAEGFADNVAAYSLDAYSVGKNYLKQRGPATSLKITTASGGPDGRGITFGADNGTPRRYRHGDMLQFYDRGNVIEQYVSKVAVADKRDGRLVEQPEFGSDQRLKGDWERAIAGVIGLGGTTRGLANAI